MPASATVEPQVCVRSEHTDKTAVVYLPREHLDEATEAQIRRMIDHPAVECARVMPDCHKGTGCCVGFTCALGGCVSPAIIGGDIGCGISALPLPATTRALNGGRALEKLLAAIHATVPMGNGAKGDHTDANLAGDDFVTQVLAHADLQMAQFAAAYEVKSSASWAKERPVLNAAWLAGRLTAWGLPLAQLKRQAGTLGGGNHFVEVNQLCGEDDLETSAATPAGLLTVHSGSRCVGQAVYRFWMRVALRNQAAAKEEASATEEDAAEKLSRPATHDDEELDLGAAYGHGVTLTGDDARGYCADMVFAQSFAIFNRARMITAVARAANIPFPSGGGATPSIDTAAADVKSGEGDAEPDMGSAEDTQDSLLDFINGGGNNSIDDDDGDDETEEASESEATTTVIDPARLIDSTHNYIDFKDWTVRKGAISAHAGERCIIAQNMRDGVWLCEGRGAAEWNMSAPHGTGRVKGRTAAAARDKKQGEVLLKQFRQEMRAVLSHSVGVDTLDERPSVYRDSSVVANAMGPAVRILAHYRPLANAK